MIFGRLATTLLLATFTGSTVTAMAAEHWDVQFRYRQLDSTLTINDLVFPSAKRGIACGFVTDRKEKDKPVVLVTSDGGDFDPRALRTALRQKLPAYMTPARFELLKELPRLPSGKANRNALTRCIGQPTPPEVDLITRPLLAGDRYLFCTDGVTRMIPDSELGELLGQPDDPETAIRAIVSLAVRRGGPDNATGVIVFVDEV